MLSMMNMGNDNVGPNSHSERAAQRIADLASNMRTGRSTASMNDLGPAFRPGPCDVICARGKSAFNHEGNKRFRTIIEGRMEQYASTANKFEKSVIVSQVVDEIRQASPGGGFVRTENARWYEVGDHIAREKVGQSFRDLLHSKYRSSTKAKKLRKQKNCTTGTDETEFTPNDATSGSDLLQLTIPAARPDRAVSAALEYQRGTLHLPTNPQAPGHGNRSALLEPVTSTSGSEFASTRADQVDVSALEPLDAFTDRMSRLSGNIPPPELSLLMRILEDGESVPAASSGTADHSQSAADANQRET